MASLRCRKVDRSDVVGHFVGGQIGIGHQILAKQVRRASTLNAQRLHAFERSRTAECGNRVCHKLPLGRRN